MSKPRTKLLSVGEAAAVLGVAVATLGAGIARAACSPLSNLGAAIDATHLAGPNRIRRADSCRRRDHLLRPRLVSRTCPARRQHRWPKPSCFGLQQGPPFALRYSECSDLHIVKVTVGTNSYSCTLAWNRSRPSARSAMRSSGSSRPMCRRTRCPGFSHFVAERILRGSTVIARLS